MGDVSRLLLLVATHATLAFGMLSTGCASTRLVLAKPISDQCMSAGLKGCPELTEGVLDYVDGDQAGGDAKLDAGIRENAAGQLKDFAESLRGLESLPGSDSFMQPLHEIIDKIEAGSDQQGSPPTKPRDEVATRDAKDDEHSRGERRRKRRVRDDDDGADGDGADDDSAPPRPHSPKTSPDDDAPTRRPPLTLALDPSHLLSGTVMAANDSNGGACDAPARLVPGVGAKAYCTKAVSGPIVLTDVHAGGACPVDVLLVVGDFSVARLVIPVPAHTPVHTTGARISVGPLETVSIAALKTSDAAATDARCAITWSGWKP